MFSDLCLGTDQHASQVRVVCAVRAVRIESLVRLLAGSVKTIPKSIPKTVQRPRLRENQSQLVCRRSQTHAIVPAQRRGLRNPRARRTH
jgi:hypothetical protein